MYVFSFIYFLHVNPSLTRGEARSSMSQLFIWVSGVLADQQTKQTMVLCMGVCVGHKTKADATHIRWKWFFRFGLAPCKHDWIAPAPQHMAENKCGWIYPHKYPEDAAMIYRAGTSYTATMMWVGCGKGFDSLCWKNISVPVRDT